MEAGEWEKEWLEKKKGLKEKEDRQISGWLSEYEKKRTHKIAEELEKQLESIKQLKSNLSEKEEDVKKRLRKLLEGN
jgi:pyruvoyl-dependent arginine decarboxylase (PvlArgDC)